VRTIPVRRASLARSTPRFISITSPEFGVQGLFGSAAAPASGPWIGANDPVAVPFTLKDAATVYQFAWMNGTSVGDGVDMGIYDLAFNRLASIGGVTAAGTASGWEFNNIADVTLAAGRYYLAMARDVTTANRAAFWPTTALANIMAALGVFDSATDAYPLPNPLTNMALAATQTRYPIMGMMARAT